MSSPMKSSSFNMASPRARAHTLKAMNTFPTKSMPKKVKKKKGGGGGVPKPEMFLYESSNDDLSTARSIYMEESIASLGMQNSTTGSRMGDSEDLARLQSRLSQSMEESELLRNRLKLESQEKQNLESKVSELTEKLVEAKKGLQETSLALHKVQMATNQLMSKRDQREIDLQIATEQNRTYERKIAELEAKIVHMEGLSNAKLSASQHSEKLLADRLSLIRTLEDENTSLRNQFSQSKRDHIRVMEEKNELEYLLEAKKKRVATLEEHVKSLEAQQEQSLERMTTNRDAYFNSVVSSFDAVATRMSSSPPRPTTTRHHGQNRGRSESPTQSAGPYDEPEGPPDFVANPPTSPQQPHLAAVANLAPVIAQLPAIAQQQQQVPLAVMPAGVQSIPLSLLQQAMQAAATSGAMNNGTNEAALPQLVAPPSGGVDNATVTQLANVVEKAMQSALAQQLQHLQASAAIPSPVKQAAAIGVGLAAANAVANAVAGAEPPDVVSAAAKAVAPEVISAAIKAVAPGPEPTPAPTPAAAPAPVPVPAPVPLIDKEELDKINKKLSEMTTMEHKLVEIQTDKSTLESRLMQLEKMLQQQQSHQQQMHEQQQATIQSLNQSLVASMQREQAVAAAAAAAAASAASRMGPPILSRGGPAGITSKPNSANATMRASPSVTFEPTIAGNRPVSATAPILMNGSSKANTDPAAAARSSFSNMFYNGEAPTPASTTPTAASAATAATAASVTAPPSSANSTSATPVRVATPVANIGTTPVAETVTPAAPKVVPAAPVVVPLPVSVPAPIAAAVAAVVPTTVPTTTPVVTTASTPSAAAAATTGGDSNATSRPTTGPKIVFPEGESLDMLTSRNSALNANSLTSVLQAYHSGTLSNIQPQATNSSSKPGSAGDAVTFGAPSMSFSEPAYASNGPSRANTAATSVRAATANSASSAESSGNEDLRKKISDERREVKKQILAWNKKFIEDNKREATKQEREKNIGTLYRRYRQTTKLLKELESSGKNNDADDNDD